MDLLIQCSPKGLVTFSLTTKGSWLRRGRIAKPLVSPLTPVPHKKYQIIGNVNYCYQYANTRFYRLDALSVFQPTASSKL